MFTIGNKNIYIMFTIGNKMSARGRLSLVLEEWRRYGPPPAKPREMDVGSLMRLPHIIDIIGVRRAGKTYLMFHMARKLISKGEKVLYVNLEDRRLLPINWDLMNELEKEAISRARNGKRIFLMVDEAQEFPEWGRWARGLYDRLGRSLKLMVSGSTSRLLQPEISSLISGRHVTVKLLPLSFREFLSFRGVKPPEVMLPEDELALLREFDEYMSYGGFPEVALLKEGRDLILRSYYEDILYRDLIDRFKIRESIVMENFLKYLLTNVGRPFSIRRARDYLSSFGIRTSTRTILRYISMLEEIFLFFFLTIKSRGVRDVLKYPRKAYAVDVGLSRVVSHEEDKGFKLENLVFLEMKRWEFGDPKLSIYYWRNRRGEEVDFIVIRGDRCEEAVQVTWDLSIENRKRELEPLIKCCREMGCKRATIVTYDQEDVIKVGGVSVKVIPAYKWMM